MADEVAWVADSAWTGFEVNRQGDNVFLILDSEETAEVRGLMFSRADAETVGLALFHASQEAADD